MNIPSTGDNKPIDDDWIREHYPRIHRAAWLMTGDAWEAEDLAQETFIVALDRWDSFRGQSARETWLYGILIRVSQRRNRSIVRMKRRLARYAELFISSNQYARVEQAAAQRQWNESVWADVARLPADQQVAVTLRFAQEMSYQQIADTVGCPLGTAKTRVHHGLKRLQRMAKQEEYESTDSAQRPIDQPLHHAIHGK